MKTDKIHLGVYGIYVVENQILMIQKMRGPYAGLYDLPGGKIELKESIDCCLSRELKEETNAELKDKKFFMINEFICHYEKNKESRLSHHVGMYYLINVSIKKLKKTPDNNDSNGALFVPLNLVTKKNTSPIAYKVIQQFKNNSKSNIKY